MFLSTTVVEVKSCCFRCGQACIPSQNVLALCTDLLESNLVILRNNLMLSYLILTGFPLAVSILAVGRALHKWRNREPIKLLTITLVAVSLFSFIISACGILLLPYHITKILDAPLMFLALIIASASLYFPVGFFILTERTIREWASKKDTYMMTICYAGLVISALFFLYSLYLIVAVLT